MVSCKSTQEEFTKRTGESNKWSLKEVKQVEINRGAGVARSERG